MLAIGTQPAWLHKDRVPREPGRSLAFVPLTSADSRIFSESLHHFAAIWTNPFRMISFHKRQDNLRPDHTSRRIASSRTLLESAHSAKNRSGKFAPAKPFRMTTFANPAKQPLCNYIVYKKGWGIPSLGAALWPLVYFEDLCKSYPHAATDSPTCRLKASPARHAWALSAGRYDNVSVSLNTGVSSWPSEIPG